MRCNTTKRRYFVLRKAPIGDDGNLAGEGVFKPEVNPPSVRYFNHLVREDFKKFVEIQRSAGGGSDGVQRFLFSGAPLGRFEQLNLLHPDSRLSSDRWISTNFLKSSRTR